jgi:hypothetical protein
VPLSIPYIGVYHARLEGQETSTASVTNGPSGESGTTATETSLAQPGDKGLRVLPRLLAHPIFRSGDDALRYWKSNPRGWALHDSIPSTSWAGVNWVPRLRREINYQPGEWKVRVETTDGREIGRVYFSLAPRPGAACSFEIDIE